MFAIRHTVQDRVGNVLIADDLPEVFDEEPELMHFLERTTEAFDHNGYDGENDRWWAWNDVTAAQVHYWWKVPLAA